jgi:hypothetical protein
MPHEFTDYPPEPETQSASGRGARPPYVGIAADLLDPHDATTPPSGLVPRRWHVSVWVGIALLLGALVALFLIGMFSG